MAIIRRVFGPFGAEETSDTLNKPVIRWHFFGILGDHTMANWSLTYTPDTRTFRVARMVDLYIRIPGQGYVACQSCIFPDAYLDPDEPVHEGRVTDILRKHLPPAELARATALGLTKGHS